MAHDGHVTATRTASAAIVAGVCVLLAGCTAGAPGVMASPTSIATPTSTPSPTPTAACIVGAWAAGAQQLQPLYDAIPTGLDYPAAEIDPEAKVVVSFAVDETFALEQHVPVTLTWMDRPAAVELGGTMAGDYRTSGTTISLTATDDALTAVPRDERRASALFAIATQETLSEWPVTATSFSCDGDGLVLDLETEGHTASVEFVRQ